MAKAVDWSGISTDALVGYARHMGWVRAKGSRTEWTYTTGSPRSMNIRFARIAAGVDVGETARTLRVGRQKLAPLADMLRAWTTKIAAASAATAAGAPQEAK